MISLEKSKIMVVHKNLRK